MAAGSVAAALSVGMITERGMNLKCVLYSFLTRGQAGATVARERTGNTSMRGDQNQSLSHDLAREIDPEQIAELDRAGEPDLPSGMRARAAKAAALAIPPPPRQGDGSTLARVLQHGLGGLALVAIEQEGSHSLRQH